LKILLVGNYLPDRQHSMLGFTGLMEQGLKNAGHDVQTLYPPVVFGRVGQRVPAASKWLGYIDKLALLPLLLNKAVHEADIVHICDHSNAVYVPAKRQTPFVVTCHDLLAVRGGLGEQTDCPATPMGSLLQRWILRGLARADGLACDSTATLNDATRLLPSREQPPELLPIALKYDYHPLSDDQCKQELRKVPGLDLSKPFILHVGSSLRRKNREGILRTFAKVRDKTNVQLVFAGRPLEAAQKQLANQLGLHERILEIGEVSSELLVALYRNALAFFFPSRFEGFGWPIIEAQYCGCPVICSTSGPLPEVAGTGALMRDVEDEEGFAEDIVRLVNDAKLRAALVEKGSENILRYQPETMISRYLALYERVLNHPSWS
jgi:glycosyltransferase involved in cell wall biosynthesis